MQFGDKMGEKIIYTNGSFTKKLIWFSGWDKKLAQEYRKKRVKVKFIHGLSGKETEVLVEEIKPIVIFDYI